MNMKKIASLLLALVLVLAMAVPAMAATVSNATSGHSYKAYQIFSGTQATNDATLGDVVWGNGVNGEALLAALKEGYNYFEDCNTAADVANVLSNKADNCDEAKALAATATKHLTTNSIDIAAGATEVTLTTGYWLLVDVTDTTVGDARNAALLQVTNKGDITIAVKYDAPEVEKKIVDGSDKVNESDENVGDTVTFELTATMPSNLEGYETYKVIFHDTLSAGLAYSNSLTVTIDEVVIDSSKYTVTTGTASDTEGAYVEGTTLTVTIADALVLGAKESSAIVVTYTAVLDDDAVIGTAGNPNKVKLEYSNDPNWNGEGTEPTEDTPEDEVKVYTWELPVYKFTGTVNSDGTVANKTPLAGAGFTLYTNAECTTAVNLVSKGNNVYTVCTQTGCTDHTHVTEIVTTDTGKFEIEGLEQGTYYLKETTTPAGYNTCANVTVVIGEDGKINATEENANGVTEVEILNQAGSTLPETGGMGTTILYVAGGVLVLAAVVLLITKKRMAASK